MWDQGEDAWILSLLLGPLTPHTTVQEAADGTTLKTPGKDSHAVGLRSRQKEEEMEGEWERRGKERLKTRKEEDRG